MAENSAVPSPEAPRIWLSSEQAQAWLCPTCQSLFTHEVLSLPHDVRKEHLSCRELLVSAENCELCRCILATGAPTIDLRNASITSKSEGTVIKNAFADPRFADDKICITFGTRSKGSMDCGLSVSVKSNSPSPSSGCLFMRPISKSQFDNAMARRRTTTRYPGPCTLALIQEWTDRCLDDHALCRRAHESLPASSMGPARLLKVANQGETVQLITVDKAVPPLMPYLTLSHCWGKSVRSKLLTTNIEVYEDGIPLDKMTKTFRDAFWLTPALGYSYIWIDALCIIQDSPEDRRTESKKMGAIYSKAALNIAAMAAQDGDAGIFQDFSDQHMCPIPYQTERGTFFNMIYGNNAFEGRTTRSPLASRGWVLQERILSPRTVQFAADQVLWECFEQLDSELLPSNDFPWIMTTRSLFYKPSFFRSVKESPEDADTSLHHAWATFVRQYTKCLLTVASDKLPAISGFASVVAKQRNIDKPGSYLAGLWRGELRDGLLWAADPEGPTMVMHPGRAPSWSWARLDGWVSFPMLFEFDRRCLSILSATTKTTGDDFYGAAPTGTIVLQGPICMVRIDGSHPGENILVQDNVLFLPNQQMIQWDDTSAGNSKAMERQLYFLIFDTDFTFGDDGWCRGLMLEPSGRKRGQYERVGYMELIWKDNSREHKDLAFTRFEDLPDGYLGFDAEKGHILELV